MKNTNQQWSTLPYAGEQKPPSNPEEPGAGSWATHFIQLQDDYLFTKKNGDPIHFQIKDPQLIDFTKELGIVENTLNQLTDTQIDQAKFWGTGPPTKQIIPILDKLIDTYQVPAPRAARILAAVLAAINDTFVVTWFLKFKYDVARPNQVNPSFETLLCTPRHPSYPSGHATIAGCTEVVLSYFFPGEAKRLKEISKECADSRLYAGVHYPIDNIEGLRLGRQMGRIVVAELKKEYETKNKTIDKPYTRNLKAITAPPPYEQVIPYPYKNNCDSLLLENNKEQPSHAQPLSKPRLYIK
ncbi:vanadium-dependent haloperoxidase [Litchfieldia alkalitelluris]|uniref:vanadium-dependent haloperoxidase n=1 Tax=Litchfieldia alkalitelluris TaxID=304268 RepID=UPI00099676CE|nr:vanadium-dependent haloperoxidase [Litchfieldia alkalitelluris]